MSVPVDLINRRNSPPQIVAEVVKEHKLTNESPNKFMFGGGDQSCPPKTFGGSAMYCGGNWYQQLTSIAKFGGGEAS